MPFRPIHRLRRWYSRIQYNSAQRPRTRWQRASDWWLIFSLPIAIAAMFLVHQYPFKLAGSSVCTVRLGKVSQNAPLEGWIERDKNDPWAIAIPYGRVSVSTYALGYGWPLRTGSRNQAYSFRLQTYNPADSMDWPTLHPERYAKKPLVIDAVISALRAERLDSVADEWLKNTQRNLIFVFAMFAQSIIFWMVLFGIGLLILQILKIFIPLVYKRKRNRTIKRIRSGQCPRCKYNLGDQQFPKRCPECGQRIWG